MASNGSKGSFKLLLILLAASVAALILVFFVYDEGLRVTFSNKGPAISGDSQLQRLETQSRADDVGSIDRDLNSTNLNNIDDGATQIQNGLTTSPN